MDLHAVAQWKWMLILLLVLALAVAELISVRRAIRRARTAPRDPGAAPPPA